MKTTRKHLSNGKEDGTHSVQRKVNYDNIAREVRAASCCSKQCIQSILTISDIFKTREHGYVIKTPREAQGQFLSIFFQVARR